MWHLLNVSISNVWRFVKQLADMHLNSLLISCIFLSDSNIFFLWPADAGETGSGFHFVPNLLMKRGQLLLGCSTNTEAKMGKSTYKICFCLSVFIRFRNVEKHRTRSRKEAETLIRPLVLGPVHFFYSKKMIRFKAWSWPWTSRSRWVFWGSGTVPYQVIWICWIYTEL